ncbi:hypothetical protein JNW87_09735, partial [Micromonospora sp. ATA51]
MHAGSVAGTTQRFGVPMGFGGPHAGYLAVRIRCGTGSTTAGPATVMVSANGTAASSRAWETWPN